MRKVELLTTDGVYVATVEIAPFPDAGMPRVVRWGERCFTISASEWSDPIEKPRAYREAFAEGIVPNEPAARAHLAAMLLSPDTSDKPGSLVPLLKAEFERMNDGKWIT